MVLFNKLKTIMYIIAYVELNEYFNKITRMCQQLKRYCMLSECLKK